MLRNILNAGFLAITAIVLVAGNLQAQTQANANIGASATVLTALTITKNTDVAFGNVGATTAGIVYLDPKGIATSNYVGASAGVGTFTIAGANTQSIKVGWPTNIDLTDGTNHLNYVLDVNGYTANTQASSGLLTLTSGYVSVTTSGTGGYFLWVGGQLGGSGTSAAALSSQAATTYNGTANFTVEYN